jgi:hypothetical protein
MFDALPGLQETAILVAIGVLLFGAARVLYNFVDGLAADAEK